MVVAFLQPRARNKTVFSRSTERSKIQRDTFPKGFPLRQIVILIPYWMEDEPRIGSNIPSPQQCDTSRKVKPSPHMARENTSSSHARKTRYPIINPKPQDESIDLTSCVSKTNVRVDIQDDLSKGRHKRPFSPALDKHLNPPIYTYIALRDLYPVLYPRLRKFLMVTVACKNCLRPWWVDQKPLIYYCTPPIQDSRGFFL